MLGERRGHGRTWFSFGARKERDEAISRQVQQQKMLVERSGNVQAALQVPMKENTPDKAQASEVAALKISLESLQQDLRKAKSALEESAKTQQEQMSNLVSASSALQAVHSAICQGDAGQAALSSAGIGIKVMQECVVVNGKKTTRVRIGEVSKGGPAVRDFKVGDVIVGVEGQSCLGKDSRAVEQMLFGIPGGLVNVKANRDGKVFETMIKREENPQIVASGARVAPEDLERQATTVAANLYAQIEVLSMQVVEANVASEKAASSASSEVAKLRAQLEEQDRVQGESNRQIQDLINACKVADKKAADVNAELQVIKANEAKRRISWDEKALSNDDLQSKLKEAHKQLDGVVERAEQLEDQLKEKDAAERQQMMVLEEAHNAVTNMYSAICNQSAQGPVGGVGISLGAAEVSVKGKKKNVIKINGIAMGGPAALTGLVAIGDVLLEVDGRDVSKLDAKSAKDLVKGQPGSVVRYELGSVQVFFIFRLSTNYYEILPKLN